MSLSTVGYLRDLCFKVISEKNVQVHVLEFFLQKDFFFKRVQAFLCTVLQKKKPKMKFVCMIEVVISILV